MWHGAGVKMKTLELMGAGLPVAGTTVAFEGIAVEHGVDGLIADDPSRLAAALTEVLDDPAQAGAIGRAAHERIVREHTWEHIIGRYDEALRSARRSTRSMS